MLFTLLMVTAVASAAPVTGSGSASADGLPETTSTVSVSNPYGSVTVQCASGTTASVSSTWSLDGADAKTVSGAIETKATKTAAGVDIAVAAPKSIATLTASTVDLVVSVPAKGTYTVVAGDGSVSVTACAGSLDARNDSGAMTVAGAFDALQLTATSGDIDVTVSSGTLGKDSRIEARAGNIAMSMPGLNAALDISGQSVEVSNIAMSMPGFSAATQSKTQLIGTNGAGGAQLKVQAAKGKVTFRP